MEKKEIYIVLTKTRTNLSKMIRFFTQKPYNHISLALDASLYRLYSFGRRRPTNPFITGFIREDIERGFYHYYNDTTCIVYRLKVTPEQYQRLEQFLTPFLRDPLKYRFNFIGLVTCGLHIPFARKNRYFCSQFVSEALSNSGILRLGRDFRLVQPADFLGLENAVEVYRGKNHGICGEKTRKNLHRRRFMQRLHKEKSCLLLSQSNSSSLCFKKYPDKRLRRLSFASFSRPFLPPDSFDFKAFLQSLQRILACLVVYQKGDVYL